MEPKPINTRAYIAMYMHDKTMAATTVSTVVERVKVLFTDRYRWQNFCPSLICLVDRLYSYSQDAKDWDKSFAICNGR